MLQPYPTLHSASTFGFFRIRTIWGRLGLKMDRATFTRPLDEIRDIRNDVMHFHPDGISDGDEETLRETATFFYSFSQFRQKN
jgi:hypothetical protein